MTNPNIKRIDVHELKKERENNPNLCLIDVRELEEWQELHIPGALHIPKDTIASSVSAQIPNKNNLSICIAKVVFAHCSLHKP